MCDHISDIYLRGGGVVGDGESAVVTTAHGGYRIRRTGKLLWAAITLARGALWMAATGIICGSPRGQLYKICLYRAANSVLVKTDRRRLPGATVEA